MSRWSRAEIEEAFARYQELGRRAAASGEWREWADQFTPDATYVEHFFGTMVGREAIYSWIQSTMSEWPGSEMIQFPIEWYIIDPERGWVVCQIWNLMADPGDGSILREHNFTLLKYAGDGLWSYEEDIYNPTRFIEMMENYERLKATLAEQAETEA
ncbi:nuclear transport factor 2 family protein [Candidatus Poriferisodalis sp.]|uniref:nuclear transport factor 2 family protein n=1 Tax=Candidatus Poriferisodalis sp. TaxID=3101277 RepID=UPI003B5AF7C2